MLGVVFTEFIENVERNYGLTVADNVQSVCPAHHGFTSVGNYDHTHLISMMEQLSRLTELPVEHLVRDFGRQIFRSFLNTRPEAFANVSGTAQLLRTVQHAVHADVLCLYPNAELPLLFFPDSEGDEFRLGYKSKRPFADLAHGILEASIEHYQEEWQLEREDLEGPPGTHALFIFTKPKKLSPAARTIRD